MASSGPNSCGTGASAARAGSGSGSGSAWANPTVIYANDASAATAATLSVDGQYSDWLVATNFGFSISSGSTIDGILVEYNAWTNGFGNSVNESALYITKDGSTTTGSNKASAVTWPTSQTLYLSRGGSADLWDATLSANEVNASTFGIMLSTRRNGVGYGPAVDHVRITVYYTEAVENPATRRTGGVQYGASGFCQTAIGIKGW